MKYTFPVIKAVAVLIALIVTAALPPHLLSAQETALNVNFLRGEELFMRNEPEEALPFLEKAFAEDESNQEGALYLAVCYEQLDRFENAITVYRKMLPQAGDKTALVACNLGNIYFRMGNTALAEQFYTQAISADPSYAPAHLNRANTRVRNGDLRDALPDYQSYLSLDPASPQRPRIERLVGLIQEIFAEAEIRRLMAQESSRADAEKRQRLMNEELAAAMPEIIETDISPEENSAVLAGEENPVNTADVSGETTGDISGERSLEWRGDSIQRK
ncbi:MAG: tetratricopeptide repeat protein [Spirochaetaceae bacterium]|nr:tetratricopeptide repeat protein [Spirochaetaceae bacterium]